MPHFSSLATEREKRQRRNLTAQRWPIITHD